MNRTMHDSSGEEAGASREGDEMTTLAGDGPGMQTDAAAAAVVRFDDHDLRYWLANEDWDMSQYTRRWLERTAPTEAADVLAKIAEGAQPEPSSLLYRLVLVVALSGFANSVGGVAERKAGVRAALMLARLGDRRAVAPLTRVFDPYGSWQSKYQRNIEGALTRLLTDAARTDGAAHLDEVTHLVARTWPADGKVRADLTPALAELLVACVGYLRAAGSASASTALRSLASRTVDSARHPNRARVQGAAAQAVRDEEPPAPTTR